MGYRRTDPNVVSSSAGRTGNSLPFRNRLESTESVLGCVPSPVTSEVTQALPAGSPQPCGEDRLLPHQAPSYTQKGAQ